MGPHVAPGHVWNMLAHASLQQSGCADTCRILLYHSKSGHSWLHQYIGRHLSPRGVSVQVRNYVLHPYKMVKDLRTGVETGNAAAVLDGELDAFMQAFLRHKGTRPPAG